MSASTLKAQTALRLAALSYSVRMGYMTINQARASLGLPGLDTDELFFEYLLPDNWIGLVSDECE